MAASANPIHARADKLADAFISELLLELKKHLAHKLLPRQAVPHLTAEYIQKLALQCKLELLEKVTGHLTNELQLVVPDAGTSISRTKVETLVQSRTIVRGHRLSFSFMLPLFHKAELKGE